MKYETQTRSQGRGLGGGNAPKIVFVLRLNFIDVQLPLSSAPKLNRFSPPSLRKIFKCYEGRKAVNFVSLQPPIWVCPPPPKYFTLATALMLTELVCIQLGWIEQFPKTEQICFTKYVISENTLCPFDSLVWGR